MIREFQVREAKMEAAKTNLLAMIAVNTPSFSQASDAREWSGKVRKVWSEYVHLQHGMEVPKEDNRDRDMLEAYSALVKDTKPVLEKTESGELKVSGLESLLKAFDQ